MFKNVKVAGVRSDIWRFYRQPGDDKEMPTSVSFSILTACHQAILFRIAHHIVQAYCYPVVKVTQEAVYTLYKQLEEWKNSLPDELRINSNKGNPLPHVLYLQ